MATGVYNKIKSVFAVGSGGGSTTTSDGGDAPIIGDSDPVETYEQQIAKLNPIAEETTRSLTDVWTGFWGDWGEDIGKAVEKAKMLMSSLGEVTSSIAKKETITLENEKAMQQEIMDADYEQEAERIANSLLTEEEKAVKMDELNAIFNNKKLLMDEKMAKKEKELKIKQAFT